MNLDDWIIAGQNFQMAYGLGYMHNKNKQETCAIARRLGVEEPLVKRFENDSNKYAEPFYMEVGKLLSLEPPTKF